MLLLLKLRTMGVFSSGSLNIGWSKSSNAFSRSWNVSSLNERSITLIFISPKIQEGKEESLLFRRLSQRKPECLGNGLCTIFVILLASKRTTSRLRRERNNPSGREARLLCSRWIRLIFSNLSNRFCSRNDKLFFPRKIFNRELNPWNRFLGREVNLFLRRSIVWIPLKLEKHVGPTLFKPFPSRCIICRNPRNWWEDRSSILL